MLGKFDLDLDIGFTWLFQIILFSEEEERYSSR